ncbi:nucleotide triphosphate hydrolase protein [Rhizobium etli]|uniref:Nucleotide triphosphate hydrolase protein n=1 Tax=Rhizobium etli TaxID=29449 RepID=A0AAN1BDZ6_RHIET|nr:helicase HerA-like C-terminal domain-containing protein [Rhizobium etli]AGS21027.1 nucleotide triphosphate hydrolase protein [Rhizobium etli bv. mimosae str. Mim1]ARQ09308.1 nucleotide triphosphate hydrolase protein [Rhizobium etli]
MIEDGKIFIGASRNPDDSINKPEYLDLKFGNRHGLVTGATGTGKTVTLQVLAEGFSRAGVPVFAADIKGDLSGIAAKGEPKDFLIKRAEQIGFTDYEFDQFPVIFWDLFGQKGHRVRTTVAEMGPLLLARLMDASEPQEGVINIAFKIADQAGLPLLDLKDFTSLLNYMGENATELSSQFGLISKASVGSIQRALLVLEQQGAEHFFGEPALKISDIMRTHTNGYGQISVLAADKLMMNPRLYATFLLWLLSELFEELPEVGDPEKPKLVFFFDEAHLLFNDAPKVLIERVEQVVRLIRSKGVGVYFVTQNPLDVPETVLAQLGNRAQHALRAYSPREQKAVKTAADTFRPNPAFDCATVITNLGTGEALVSTLEAKGAPSIVERTLIRPPSGRVGPLTDGERQQVIDRSPVLGIYDEDVDRESAFEMLAARAKKAAEAEAAKRAQEDAAEQPGTTSGWTLPGFGGDDDNRQGRGTSRGRSGYQRETVVEAAMKSVARTVATQVGRALVRGILGSLKR